jgi:mono/diheme cytochrome c family protein
MNFKNIINLKAIAVTAVACAFVAGLTTSCEEVPNSPGFEFMPDMYRTRELRYYTQYSTDPNGPFKGDSMMAERVPVAGTIARGYLPAIPAGMTYDQAATALHNPFPYNAQNEERGKVLYGKFCTHCHGDAGHGDGKVGQKMPGPPPAYDAGAVKNLPEGKIFYSISKGKGAMGPHELLLNAEERWMLVHYVQTLQGVRNTPAADSTATASIAAADVKAEAKKEEPKKEEAKH